MAIRLSAEYEKLDVTLKTGDYVPMFLAAWLLEAARDPAAVRARIVDTDPGHLIELQNTTTGIASGGLVYDCMHGAVHVTPAVDPSNPRGVKKRSIADMRAALSIVMARREAELRGDNGNREVYVILAFGVGMLAGALLTSYGSPF